MLEALPLERREHHLLRLVRQLAWGAYDDIGPRVEALVDVTPTEGVRSAIEQKLEADDLRFLPDKGEGLRARLRAALDR